MFAIGSRKHTYLLTQTLAALFCVVCCFASVGSPLARAQAGAQLEIVAPLVNSTPMGHPGTEVKVQGTGFAPGTLTLYTTSNNDSAQCSNNSISGSLLPFSTAQSVMGGADGSFTLKARWTKNAGTANTAYYLCALPAPPTVQGVLSSNAFTVVPPAQINVVPTTTSPGEQISVSGINWLPPQQLIITVISAPGAQPVAGATVTPDSLGSFNATLTIPAGTPARVYTVSVFAQNEPALQVSQQDVLTIAAAPASTPSATPPQSTPTVTPMATPIPAVDISAPASTDSSTWLIGPSILYMLGGTGVLFVLIGLILLIMSAARGSATG